MIPETVTTIESNAFSGCTALTHVSIRGPVTIIPQNMFYGCTALEEVVIPASVQRINSGAFDKCNALKDIFYEGTEEMWNQIEIVAYKNEVLFSDDVTVHFGYNAVYLMDVRYYSSSLGGIYLVGPNGEDMYRTSPDLSDKEFLENKNALLATYVSPVLIKTDDGFILKNLLFQKI